MEDGEGEAEITEVITIRGATRLFEVWRRLQWSFFKLRSGKKAWRSIPLLVYPLLRLSLFWVNINYVTLTSRGDALPTHLYCQPRTWET